MAKKSRKRAKSAPPSQEQRLEELLAGVEEYASPLDPEEEPRLYWYSNKLLDATAELRRAAADGDLCRVVALAMNAQHFLNRILYDRWRDAQYAAQVEKNIEKMQDESSKRTTPPEARKRLIEKYYGILHTQDVGKETARKRAVKGTTVSERALRRWVDAEK